MADFYDLASYKTFWRGYWYYKNGNVLSFNKISDYEYEGKVKSDSEKIYDVSINLDKPYSSKCSCPFVEGKRRLCKHMIALYFAVFPEEAKHFDEEIRNQEEEQGRIEHELELRAKEIRKEVKQWSKEDLINFVVNTMLDDYYKELDKYYDNEERFY